MKGLKTSIWAPLNPHARDLPRSNSVPPNPSSPTHNAPKPSSANHTTGAARTSSLSAAQALHRFEQVCQRLRWKFVDLEAAYSRAITPAHYGFTPEDAERNFKVDFHEFYVWIEQAVVLLLQVFGIEIREPPGARHMYHHNVLMAAEEGVYAEVLGKGDVKAALWKAKELRNRWKDAAEGKETPPLGMYDLGWIVRSILGGLEGAYGVAQDEVRRAQEASMGDTQNEQTADITQEEGWDWMVESMDWEA